MTSVCSRRLRTTPSSASGPWPSMLVELGTGRWPRGSTDPREEHLPESLKVKQSCVSEGGKMSQKQLSSRKPLTQPDWPRPCPSLQPFTSVLASGRGHLLLHPGQRWGTGLQPTCLLAAVSIRPRWPSPRPLHPLSSCVSGSSHPKRAELSTRQRRYSQQILRCQLPGPGWRVCSFSGAAQSSLHNCSADLAEASAPP